MACGLNNTDSCLGNAFAHAVANLDKFRVPFADHDVHRAAQFFKSRPQGREASGANIFQAERQTLGGIF